MVWAKKTRVIEPHLSYAAVPNVDSTEAAEFYTVTVTGLLHTCNGVAGRSMLPAQRFCDALHVGLWG